jgi:hypothetical protein
VAAPGLGDLRYPSVCSVVLVARPTKKTSPLPALTPGSDPPVAVWPDEVVTVDCETGLEVLAPDNRTTSTVVVTLLLLPKLTVTVPPEVPVPVARHAATPHLMLGQKPSAAIWLGAALPPLIALPVTEIGVGV